MSNMYIVAEGSKCQMHFKDIHVFGSTCTSSCVCLWVNTCIGPHTAVCVRVCMSLQGCEESKMPAETNRGLHKQAKLGNTQWRQCHRYK